MSHVSKSRSTKNTIKKEAFQSSPTSATDKPLPQGDAPPEIFAHDSKPG
jgi:hypothetical protein